MTGIPNPSIAPSVVSAGDTLKFKISNADYLATSGGWTYKFTILNGSNKYGPFSSVADGEDHQVTVEEGVTATWVVGDYSYIGYFEHSGGDRWTVERGKIEIKVDAEDVSATDLRTHARTALDAINAVLENRATLDQMKYQIASRSLERTPIPELLELKDYYEAAVAKEDRKSTGPGSDTARSNRIRARFPRG